MQSLFAMLQCRLFNLSSSGPFGRVPNLVAATGPAWGHRSGVLNECAFPATAPDSPARIAGACIADMWRAAAVAADELLEGWRHLDRSGADEHEGRIQPEGEPPEPGDRAHRHRVFRRAPAHSKHEQNVVYIPRFGGRGRDLQQHVAG